MSGEDTMNSFLMDGQKQEAPKKIPVSQAIAEITAQLMRVRAEEIVAKTKDLQEFLVAFSEASREIETALHQTVQVAIDSSLLLGVQFFNELTYKPQSGVA
jgi:predicted RNA-binding Zn ribbon-like protein